MNRRQFLTSTTVAGIALPVGIASSCTATNNKPNTSLSGFDDFTLNETTIIQLQQKMQAGKLTCRQIVELYLHRINELDQNGVKLNTVIELNPDALLIADALDLERKEGNIRGAMHGIPILIKDNIDTADKMMTTAGSLALLGNFAKKDAFIVEKLRESGAVIIGKTNLSEWANFRSTRSTSGWSSRGGQTKNPYLLDRSPCGSSSGSGVAVSANLCTVAVGTETNGSIACPSSVNGIVGIKPTVGLWSRSGIIPISPSQDTAGPMARTVTDAVILLGALSGVDSNDSATEKSKMTNIKDYTKYLLSNGLKGKRIGVEKSYLKGHEGVDMLLSRALDQMKLQGATIIEVELNAALKDSDSGEFELLKFEFKYAIEKYLSGTNLKCKTLSDLIEFNKKNQSKVMPYFNQEIFESAQMKGDLTSKEYKDLYDKVIVKARNEIDKMLINNKLNAICGPANGPAWCTDLINGDALTGYGAYSPSAIAGYPSITVPMGVVHDLPIGLAFFGKAFSEPELISIAYAYEQISKNRVKPEFKTAIN